MSASENLSPRQFRMQHVSANDTPGGDHMLMAHGGNGRRLGLMTWDQGTVQSVTVKPNWQHQGIATQMWNRANEITPGLSHSGNRSDAGEGWSSAVGGPRPERTGKGE